MDNPKELQTCISLCTGYGGLERGVYKAIRELRTLAYVEIEAYAIANLVSKMEQNILDCAPVWTNVKTFSAKPFRGCVDIITGGYPCQPFSVAGNREGESDERHIWPHIKRIVSECMPRQVFFENVEGHLSCGIVQVLADLEEMGYGVEAGLFSAEEVGAPHQRKRVFILGELVNTDRNGLCGYTSTEEGKQKRWSKTSTVSNGYVANTNSVHDKGKFWKNNNEGRKSKEQSVGLCDGTVWPARQGQMQYEWEHPRVKPRMGRAINGYTTRIDQLRLLGNGVVPQTAYLAYITLSRKLHEKIQE